MAETYGPTGRTASRELGRVADQASDVAEDVKSRVSDAASRVQERASELGKSAASRINAATNYFREHDTKEMLADVNSWVKANPAQALVAAAVVGFVTATLIRRR